MAVLRLDGSNVRGLTQLPRSTRDLYFRREVPYRPDRTALAAFVGNYSSEELDVTYHVVVGDSGLVFRARRMDEAKIEPAWADAFTMNFDTTVEFTRTGKRVDGFTIADGRVRGVQFVRVGG